MTLGDLGSNLNKQGNNLYNQQKGRIMREAEDQKKRMEAQEADKMRMETSHKKLEKQTIEGRVNRLRQEIIMAGRRGFSTSSAKADIALKERQLQELTRDKIRLEGEIRQLETGAHGMAHNLHYNNPTYF
ncbi:MAG: hypothetical protein WCV55_01585 [Candidatus Paceibacterota bacterium]